MNMKSKLWGGIAAAGILLGGSIYSMGVVQAAPAAGQSTPGSQATQTSQAARTSQSTQAKPLIGVSKAEQYALKEFQGRVESVELEGRTGSPYYEVEIKQGNREVDVLIDGYTGKTLHVRNDDDDNDNDDYEADHYKDWSAANTASTALGSSQSKGNIISAAAAAEAAGTAAKGKVTEVDLDRDNGKLRYEVELRNGSISTEVGIDAYTGKVLYVDTDNDEFDDDAD